MKTSLLALSISLIPLSALAKPVTILVSDLDDTIKVSYVLDPESAIENGAMIHNVFLGMPELYHAIAKTPELKTIKYLSNAPKKIIGDLHQRFLDFNDFPEGELVTRSWTQIFSGSAHKLRSLRAFIKKYNPQSMILIGDNGEADAQIYAEIRKEYPAIAGATYIRQAYSSHGFDGNFAKPLLEGQIPFASSIDIALDLYNKGLLEQSAVTELVRSIVPDMLDEDEDETTGRTAFPEWYDCRDFALPALPPMLDPIANDLLQAYGEKVQFRCALEPFDD